MDDLATLRGFLANEDPKASAALDSLLGFEEQEWITVFQRDNSDEGDGLRMACFVRPEAIEHALAYVGFDQIAGDGRPGFVGTSDGTGSMEYKYLTVGAEEVVPLIFNRYFPVLFPDVVELAEDFRLFWDLYEDRASGKFLTTDEVGDAVSVAEWRDNVLYVRKRYLRRYQAARQLLLSLQVVVDRRGGDNLKHLNDVSYNVSEDLVIFSYYGGASLMSDDRPNFTHLIGKRIILPPAIESSDVWPYETPREYEMFIIGLDEEGDPITHHCDPDNLANYFGKNSDSPHYLTPVFFNRSVLDKFYADTDRYQIEDGYVRAAGSWGLRMDNAMDDHIMVFLGDLGSDVPYREQQYWRSFNVAPPGPMSETAFRRSFLGEFYDSDRVEHRFAASYTRLIDTWQSYFGWPLYKPLHEGDAHIINSIHVPTNKSFGQFDDQIIRLAKLVVDSLNETEISSAGSPPVKGERGIAKLERLLNDLAIRSDVCSTLGQVQGARTRSAAHRKGGDFDLALLLEDSPDLRALFSKILELLIEQFDALEIEVAALRSD